MNLFCFDKNLEGKLENTRRAAADVLLRRPPPYHPYSPNHPQSPRYHPFASQSQHEYRKEHAYTPATHIHTYKHTHTHVESRKRANRSRNSRRNIYGLFPTRTRSPLLHVGSARKELSRQPSRYILSRAGSVLASAVPKASHDKIRSD